MDVMEQKDAYVSRVCNGVCVSFAMGTPKVLSMEDDLNLSTGIVSKKMK